MTIRSSPSVGTTIGLWKARSVVSSDNEAIKHLSDGEEAYVREIRSDLEGPESVGFARVSDAMQRALCDGNVPHDVSAALRYGLELLSCGAMLVSADGRPRFANRAALAILQKGDGLLLSKAGLITNRATHTRLLLRLLQYAIETPELGESKESPFTLPLKHGLSSLIVRVIPGPGLDCLPGTDNRTALLMLYDQDATWGVSSEILSKLYGLTRGEAALAASLVRGKSLEAAAAELCISPHTARTHLKRIFMKTDTHRQSELVLRMFPAALAAQG